MVPAEGQESPYVDAAVYAGEAAVYTFTNTVAPFRIKVRKIWEDKGFEEFRPEEIKIQILRKAVGEPDSAYRPVAEDFDGNPLTESIDENGILYCLQKTLFPAMILCGNLQLPSFLL